MSKSERDSAARRKRAADPNQPQKSGAAKPTNVSTDPKRKMKENYFKEGIEDIIARLEKKRISKGGNPDESPLGKKVGQEMKKQQDKKRKDAGLNPDGTKIQDSYVLEAKDKKGKGSGTKDACYHKVKSRYSVWPSAYASGALVKCRKVGAANWGNKTKKEGFSPMQIAALEVAGMIELNEAGKKCWKGYKKAGTQKLFGKTYNRCVKAGDELNHDGEQLSEMGDNPSFDIKQTKTQKLQKMAQSNSPKEAEIAKKKLEQKQAKEPKLPTLNNSYAPVTEGVAFLKKEKEKKKSSSKYLTQRDAGKLAKRKMAKKDQEKVNFLEPEETNESKTRLVKNGHTYKVVLTWRGKTYMVQMFVPSVSRPTRQQVEKEVQKIYPDAKLMSFLPRDLEPGEPTVMMGEMAELPKFKGLTRKDASASFRDNSEINKKIKNVKDDPRLKKIEKDPDLKKLDQTMGEQKLNELSLDTLSQAARVAMTKRDAARGTSDYIKRQRQTEKFTNAAVKKRRELDATKDKLGKTFRGPDADRTPTMEEVVTEDDMKGMSVKSGHKRPTKAGAGMTKKGVEAYRRRNPGSKLQTAVTGKVKKGSKDAKRRKSYCARSAGQMKKFPKAAKDPNSRLRQARRRWKC